MAKKEESRVQFIYCIISIEVFVLCLYGLGVIYLLVTLVHVLTCPE